MPKPHSGSKAEEAIGLRGDRRSRDGAQSIGRAVSVLRAAAMLGRHGIHLDELCRLTAMPKSTCARIVRRLVEEGMVYKDERTHKLYLGPLVHQLGLLAQPRSTLQDFCGDSLARLARAFKDAVYLSERAGLEAVTLERELGNHRLAPLALDIGIRRPLGVAVGGIAMLAAMSPADARAVIQVIGNRYARYDGLTPEIVSARVLNATTLGYAFGDAFGNPGAKSVSVGFQIAGAQMALSVTEFSTNWPEGRDSEIALVIGQEVSAIKANFALSPNGFDERRNSAQLR